MHLDGLKTQEEKINKICDLLEENYEKGSEAFGEFRGESKISLTYIRTPNDVDELLYITDSERLLASVLKYTVISKPRHNDYLMYMSLEKSLVENINSKELLEQCADFKCYGDSYSSRYAKEKLEKMAKGEIAPPQVIDSETVNSYLAEHNIFETMEHFGKYKKHLMRKTLNAIDDQKVLERMVRDIVWPNENRYNCTESDFKFLEKEVVDKITDESIIRSFGSVALKDGMSRVLSSYYCLEKMIQHDLNGVAFDAPLPDEADELLFGRDTMQDHCMDTIIMWLDPAKYPSIDDKYVFVDYDGKVKHIKDLSQEMLQNVANLHGDNHVVYKPEINEAAKKYLKIEPAIEEPATVHEKLKKVGVEKEEEAPISAEEKKLWEFAYDLQEVGLYIDEEKYAKAIKIHIERMAQLKELS